MDDTRAPSSARPRVRYFYITYNVQNREGWTCDASVFECEDRFALCSVNQQLYRHHGKAVRIENWIEIAKDEAMGWLQLQLKLDHELNSKSAHAKHLTLVKPILRKPQAPKAAPIQDSTSVPTDPEPVKDPV